MRIIAGSLSLIIGISCLPGRTLGFEQIIQEYSKTRVEEQAKLVKKVKTLVEDRITKHTELVSRLTRGGFALLEDKSGLNKQNKLYELVKHRTLQNTGIKLGVLKGASNTFTELYSLAATIDTLDLCTVNLAFNIKEDPIKYHNKVRTSAQTFAGALAQPELVLSSVYQGCQNYSSQLLTTYNEAKKDPLELGTLQGEVAFLGGLFLVGWGETKLFTTANNVGKTAKIGNINKNLIPQIKLTAKRDFTNFLKADAGTLLPSGKYSSSYYRAKRYLEKQEIPFTYHEGDIFAGMLITEKKDNVLTLANSKIKLYETAFKFPQENYHKVKYTTFIYRDGRYYDKSGTLLNGEFTYLLDYKGNFLASPQGKYFHGELAKGKPVIWAGELKLRDGKIMSLNNYSGHYTPDGNQFSEVLQIIQKKLHGDYLVNRYFVD